MHIALLHYSAVPVVGGVEQVMAHHARHMVAAGHSVTVVAGRGGQKPGGAAFHRTPLADSRHPRVLAAGAALDTGVVPSGFAALVADVTDQLRTALGRPELVVAHNVCTLPLNLALTAALAGLRRDGTLRRLVAWHHDLAWTSPRYRPRLHDGWPWDLLRTDWADAHVTVSDARRHELAALIGRPAERIDVVPNGVDTTAQLHLGRRTRRLVGELGLAEAAPRLLLPARLTPRKNVELALRMLAALRGLMPKAALVVTGPPGPHDPANAGYLAALCGLRAELGLDAAAHLLGASCRPPLSDAEMVDWYRLCDALFLPSHEEGFGIPVLEAGLHRLVVFAADIPPLRELGAGAVTWFDPDGDPAAVARLVADRLGGDPGYRLALQARAHDWDEVYRARVAPVLAP